MKKILIAVGALVVLLIAGVLVGPSFVDWNAYKEEIAARVRAMTGRDLVINGDISVTVLPAPALLAGNVTFSNPDWASGPQMARLDSLEVRVALLPLLGGNVQVETVRLIKPVIALEAAADGRRNWVFDGMAANGGPPADAETGAPSSSGAAGGTGGGAAEAIRLDRFEIKDGLVTYRDPARGIDERIEGIDATFAAASLKGPYQSEGSLTARGIRLTYDADVGNIIHDRTVPLSLELGLGGDASLSAKGTLVSLTDAPKFKGKISGAGKTLAGLLDSVGVGGTLPGPLNQPFGLDGSLVASAQGGEASELSINLGASTMTGHVTADFGDTTRIAAELNVGHVDLDSWLALEPYSRKAAAAGGNAGEGGEQADVSVEPAAGDGNGDAGFSLPANVVGSLAAVVEGVTYRGETVGPVRLSAELANREITVSQFSAQLPGAADVAVFGFVNARDGRPRFEGETEFTVDDTRGLARWLGMDLSSVPAGRLRKGSVRANVAATPAEARITGIDARFDETRVTGGVTVALRKRPAFGANLSVDKIDLDGYLPPRGAGQSTGDASAGTGSGAGNGQSGTGADGGATASADPFSGLSALDSFDANLKLAVQDLKVSGIRARDVRLDGTLYNGDLTLREARTADVAGARVALAGVLRGFGDTPAFENVTLDLEAGSVAGLVDAFGVQLPVNPADLGRVALSARLDGGLLKPDVNAVLDAAGGTVGAAGTVSVLPLRPMFEGDVTLKHGDVRRLVSLLGIGYRPAGTVGGIDVGARVAAGPDGARLSAIKGTLGGVPVSGTADVALGGAVPKVTADLTTGAVVVDPFLPAKRTAGIWEGTAAAPVARPAATVSARWPTDPIDLGGLSAVDGDFHVASDAVSYGPYRIANADATARLAGGTLTLDKLVGNLFGGALDAKGTVGGAASSVDAIVSLRNGKLGQLLTAVTGKQTATGTIGFETSLTTTGRSVADMVSALGGKGSINMSSVDVESAARGSALSGVLGLVGGLSQLGSLPSGKSADGLADVTGTFTIERGVARTTDFKLVSSLGNGTATGTVDLAAWTIDLDGSVNLAQNFLTQVLAAKTDTQVPETLPFAISGALDKPTVRIETAALTRGGVTIPGLEKLEEKAPGVGSLIQGILGGQAPAQQQETPPPQTEPQSGTANEPVPQEPGLPQPQQPESQQQKKVSPEDLLKQILKF